MYRSLLLAAGLAVASVTGALATTTTTYDAMSNMREGAGNHSLWFSGNKNPLGAMGDKDVAGKQPNHFKFEPNGPGTFTVSGMTANLTGLLSNFNGQTFEIDLHLVEYTGTNVADKGASLNTLGTPWTYYDLSTTTQSTLNYVANTGGGPLQSFVFSGLRGGSGGKPFRVQVGNGANDKDKDKFGLSTWFTLTDSSGTCTVSCSYAGDINIVLSERVSSPPEVPLPASALLLLGALAGTGFAARRRRQA